MKIYDGVEADLKAWAEQQAVFFVASSPLRGKHVNVSPKGYTGTTFTIFDSNHAAYIDVTGSSAETISHIYEPGNNRVTIMFCSFGPLPRIMRFYCTGSVIEHDSPDFDKALSRLGAVKKPGQRAVIMLDIWKVTTSCGMSVPILVDSQQHQIHRKDFDSSVERTTYDGFIDRDDLKKWASGMEKKGKLHDYRAQKNAYSNDGLPSIRKARRDRGDNVMLEELRAVFSRATQETAGIVLGLALALIAILLWRTLNRMLGQGLSLTPRIGSIM